MCAEKTSKTAGLYLCGESKSAGWENYIETSFAGSYAKNVQRKLLVCLCAEKATNKSAGLQRAQTIILKLVLLVYMRKMYKGNCLFLCARKKLK